MRDFEYEAPATLTDAIAVLAGNNGHGKPLAGGTDLIDHVRCGRLEPDLVVDVKKIDELNVLELDGPGFRLGAAVPEHDSDAGFLLRECMCGRESGETWVWESVRGSGNHHLP